MVDNFLEFEKPIEELSAKIEELERVSQTQNLDLSEQINKLEDRRQKVTHDIFSSLDPWQITQIARHPMRPYTLDYVGFVIAGFQELHGDRMFADDRSIIAGIGKIDQRNVALIGHQKGRNTREKLRRNFGMPKPEGYRKAQRVMKLAEKFGLPIVTLIDTPGAYPGVDAEERGQSEAIARSLSVMIALRVPVITAVIGEGGSGGALAIGVCDRLIMMEYSTYSVISPEGCASILWKSPDKAPEAAAAMKITSADLKKLGLVDEIVPEPLGGAHRDPEQAAAHLNASLVRHLEEVSSWTIPELLGKRYERLQSFGQFQNGI
ncbi:MAG TPA: acetyl-CoA carboxylase carboxyl transferase subunit alpha [Gammaproteobacteria bacterium]|nr:MAG: acetyl-CoA carboxylase carboxyl transferase subunit alpha [Acidithiobacillus sp.]HBK76962.1 acetyl-CoA carboxylase carboxyl transferase subunit alpha [Gammaproteobacteria bacterium]HIB82809.1 acetyl-CoA carboxylase carboxyltransferase subunit alpha [Gammaproteobacteria bacterium]HIC21002.1 acetyl-CoA carboxylase carboxyltransferase subunit alpha [Gammaproteobacteria bacterium]HIN42388.1 acetyl-CoA carboxylase carboxyltransferase subunit alpha [Gammaproteobacteria bacterium]